MHPRFFRTQFLTALGLAVVAVLWEWSGVTGAMRALFAVGVIMLIVGSVIWTLDPPPAGRSFTAFTIAVLASLVMFPSWDQSSGPWWLVAANALASAALLGSALTAMLVGHSYLISPGITLRPLVRMIALVAVCLVARAALSGIAMYWWSQTEDGQAHMAEFSYWLPLRWLIGVIAPAVFTVMAYLTARIRSTQSATGILYVVVICVFLGEMIALVMGQSARFPF